MSKTSKARTVAATPRSFYSAQPWRCRHLKDHSEIEAYVEASGEWETVILVQPTSGNSAEALATFIISLINESQQRKDLLQDAMDALELCMEEAELTFASEQAADSVISRFKKRGLLNCRSR